VEFQWATVPGVTYYALWVGRNPNTYDIYAGVETGKSRVVKVPTDGKPIYVKLWTFSNGQWAGNDYTYTAYTAAGAEKALLSSPANGTTLTGDRVNIEWTSGVGVSAYGLWVGSSTNSYDLYGSLEPGLSRVMKVPTNGKTVYVTLWSLINGAWQSDARLYTAYTAAGAEKAQMVSPPPGTPLTTSTPKFEWTSGVGATAWALWVGTTAGTYNVYAGWEPDLWRALVLPVGGQTLYVTLWSYINGGWQGTNYPYTASGP
jgi:hypothetical protein